MSSAYLQALNYSVDLLSLPQRLIYASKGQNVDALIPMATRAIVVGVLFAVVRRVINYATARISQSENGSGGGRVGIHHASWEKKEVIGQVLPTYQHPIRMRHNGNYLWVTRRINGFAGSRSIEHFRIQDSFFAKEERELLIFHAKRINPSWQNPVSRLGRPWPSVILPGQMKGKLLRDVERFMSDKETRWYASGPLLGIPHRRGYLLYGSPGSGKPTLVTAIASKLDLNIYVMNPAQRGMDDAKLARLFRDCPSKSVILIEDIDCIFPRGRNYHIHSSEVDDEDGQGEGTIEEEVYEAELEPQTAIAAVGGGGGRGKHDLAPSTVTMSGLLNAIDGVWSQEGCVLVATTNHPNRLDSALSRAGRFDVKLEFGYAIAQQVREMYLHFYPLEDFQDSSSPTSWQAGPKDQDEKTTKIKNSEKVQADNEDNQYLSKINKNLKIWRINLLRAFSMISIFKISSLRFEHPTRWMVIMVIRRQNRPGDPFSACDNQNIEKWLEDEKAVKADESARMKRSHTKTSKSKSKSVQEEKKKKKDDEDERGDINEKVKIDPGQGNDDKEDIVETNDENNSGNEVKSD
ncbi:hypothetical protein L486_06500 [Kwoniella mangroviensis CBS 10435]|uniref:AAA+ ATPase domain-containing protein n=1 Tax=Kwoniella mangroviensis CBS 10435 TaxID=1331196 RepID=A0A1B9IJ92_9TREE|nr:hypothetical protein L486_06500 [Kwoniella mangroviensis CBS 10435]